MGGGALIRTIFEAIHSSPPQAVVYLSGGASVIVSNKAKNNQFCDQDSSFNTFPMQGSSFVIGAGTAVRLVNLKYYEGSYKRMLEILGDCKRTGCNFLVGSRDVDGVFKVLEDLDIPEEISDMFVSRGC